MTRPLSIVAVALALVCVACCGAPWARAVDGKTCSAYRDGVLTYETPQTVIPNVEGVPLWLGRCQGMGDAFFDGLIDDVRVYDRAIPYERVRAEARRR